MCRGDAGPGDCRKYAWWYTTGVPSGDLLIVDDDQDIRETIACVLELHGHTVMTASNGYEALRMLREATSCPRMIFLDLRMPVMNGWEFLEEFVRLPQCSNVPVVVLTADRTAPSQMIDGIAGFLLKPLEVSDILNAVGRYAHEASPERRL
jgi:CheY-like chemotaxis protein